MIHKSRYARWRPELGRRETWNETVDRYIDFMCGKVCSGKIPDATKDELRSAILELKVMPSMRCMMTAGPALEASEVAGYNCAAIAVSDVAAFDEAMYLLMCGCGVGFSVERQFISNLPVVQHLRKSKTTIKVEDSRMGWANAFRELLSMLYQGRIPEWDMSEVRPKGAKLVTFGGRASGPAPLVDLFNFCVNTFKNAEGRKLNSIECHDIMCKIGEVVVSGGVRRSAELSLTNPSDDRMRYSKSGNWYETAPWRRVANNSAAWTEKPGMDVFFREWLALYESKSGERGIFNRKAAQEHLKKFGRRDPDREFLTNPCVTGDMYVHTSDGLRQVMSLIDKPFTAMVDGTSHVCNTGFFSTGVKPVFRVETEDGRVVKATADHRFLAKNREFKRVDELKPGDELVIPNWAPTDCVDPTDKDFMLGWIVGEVVGDGGHNPGHYPSYVRFWGKNRAAMRAIAATTCGSTALYEKHDMPNPVTYKSKYITELCSLYITDADKALRPALMQQSKTFVAGFLRGLFDADGSVQGGVINGRSIRLSQSKLELLCNVQLMLTMFGISSTVYKNRRTSHIRLLPNGKGGNSPYSCRAQHELVISRESIARYMTCIGFSDPDKAKAGAKNVAAITRRAYKNRDSVKIASITPAGSDEVYDCTVGAVHRFEVGGLIAHNCGEILLRPDGQLCNLSEVVVRANDTLDDLKRKVELAAIMGTMQACLTDFKYLRDSWKQNTEEEALLGVSLTGIMDNKLTSGKAGKSELCSTLDALREHAVATNKKWAKLLGINQATAVTTVKPSGSVSQLTDSASGIHPRFAKQYIRTVRADIKDPVTQFMIAAGFPWEPDVMKPDATVVFSFPIKAPAGALTVDDVDAIDQLELYKIYREHWAEHNISMTVYVKEHQWLEVGAWVYKHFDELTGVTFLPATDHVYAQAPYQAVNQKDFDAMVAKMPTGEIDWTGVAAFEVDDTAVNHREYACTAGSCEIVDIGKN